MWRDFISGLRANTRGAAVIETAIVLPVLAMLALGSYDAGRMIARQSELQSAVAEAEAIVTAAVPASSTDRDAIRDVIKASIDPTNTNPNDTVTVTEIYRCGTNADFVTTNSCGTGVAVSTYVMIVLTDTFTPQWTSFGIGSSTNYNVVRTVQIS
jgi:Flp pilus assembly protein TadG